MLGLPAMPREHLAILRRLARDDYGAPGTGVTTSE